MEAGREFYWNIPLEGLVLYPLSVVATAFMIYVMVKTVKRWHVGQPEARGAPWGQRIWSFLVAVVMDGLLHRRFMRYADGIGNGFGLARMAPRELTAGFAHWLIFLGCLSFLVATTLGSLSHYTVHFMKGNFYLVFSAVIDVFGILVIIGIALALIRRYGARPKRLDNKPEDLIALLLIFVVVISGFIVEGLRIAATSLQTNPDWASWSVGGYALALAFQGASDAALAVGHSVWWWLHMASAVGAIVYVSLFHSKLFHIIWDPVNIFFRDLGPKGKLQTIDFEAAEDFGATFLWDPPVRMDLAKSLADHVIAGPRASGEVSIRIEADGSVYAPRGPAVPCGNIVEQPWDEIWAHEAFTRYRESVEAPRRCEICPDIEICAAGCVKDPSGWADDTDTGGAS